MNIIPYKKFNIRALTSCFKREKLFDLRHGTSFFHYLTTLLALQKIYRSIEFISWLPNDNTDKGRVIKVGNEIIAIKNVNNEIKTFKKKNVLNLNLYPVRIFDLNNIKFEYECFTYVLEEIELDIYDLCEQLVKGHEWYKSLLQIRFAKQTIQQICNPSKPITDEIELIHLRRAVNLISTNLRSKIGIGLERNNYLATHPRKALSWFLYYRLTQLGMTKLVDRRIFKVLLYHLGEGIFSGEKRSNFKDFKELTDSKDPQALFKAIYRLNSKIRSKNRKTIKSQQLITSNYPIDKNIQSFFEEHADRMIRNYREEYQERFWDNLIGYKD